MDENSWFKDQDQLLDEIRRTESAGFVPDIPGYEAPEEIARGGQGAVYRSRQSATGRIVAIKVMFEGAGNVTQRRIRFERELELAASLEHPGIVRIYDGGVLADGRLFAVMEFVDGETLDRFAATRNLSAAGLVELFIQICDAISYAHRRGVIHRDLKPANIVIGGDGQPHVLDFGIARAIGDAEPATRTGEFLGTLGYASPEQVGAHSDAIDTRTDIYSLGMILYRILAHATPYAVEGPIAHVVNEIQTAIPDAPSRRSPDSDADLDTIVLRCLEKIPDDRYQSVDALGADLRRYQDGDVLEARRDQSWYVLRKIIRRHRMKASVAAGLLLFLLLFSGIVTSLWQRAVNEEQKTREVNVFWEDTLGSVSPSRANQPITFLNVLDEAVHWVAITTEGRPEIEAALRTTIGNGYRNIGHFEKSEIQLQKSLEVLRQLHGENHVDVIKSLNSIALLRKSQGRTEQAEQGFLETLRARERLLGANHPDVAMSLQNLGRVAMENGRPAQADRYFQRALTIRRRHFAPDDPAIATVYFNQGDLACMAGDWKTGNRLHQQALEIRKSRLAESHPDIARSLLALSRVQVQTGDHQKARQLAEDAMRVRRLTLPPDHLRVEEIQQWLLSIDQQATGQ